MIDDEFYPPPECPVYEPNEEEFADPLSYISKIRPHAEKYGICKIRPPPHWQPPFAIDVDNFHFTPRIQRINELGIHTRLRLQFIESIAKFWTLQGISFKLPHVGGKALDLYGLHEIVKSFGGYQEVCNKKQWTHVCLKLGLQKSFSGIIHRHYEKFLYPFDMMKSGLIVEALESNEKRDSITALLRNNKKKKSMYKGSNLNLDLKFVSMASTDGRPLTKPRKRRGPVEQPLVGDVANNKELAKLQIFGNAGPKLVGLGVTPQKQATEELIKEENPENMPNKSVKIEKDATEDKVDCTQTTQPKINTINIKEEPINSQSPLSPSKDGKKSEEVLQVQTRHRGRDQTPYSMIDLMDNCKVCGKDNNDNLLLMCDCCDDNYHTYCLIPPLSSRPSGDWRCPKCIAKEINKKAQAYGFEQAQKEYSLHSFGEMADAFKSEYFGKPTHSVTSTEVEREFWRLVGSLEEDLTVEYGADIHVIEHGSGFPRMCDSAKKTLSKEEESYACSGWNLNNLPILEKSLLRSISGDISGMKVPWVYVGMCFSAFCWHIEDHWTYSINYMHWGEPKTWYGIPREDATKFEQVMEESAPELFKMHPDLLHHLVTTMNPATLMRKGVRVVRTNQCAGEFMITFPRAYHAGFNQGYNFAEAVNFCPADWVPVGSLCIEHYRKLHKCCVFSHEEIIFKVGLNADNLDVDLAAIIYKEANKIIEVETSLRKSVKELGITNSEYEAFECVPDDARQCSFCCTTIFLSAVSCPCTPSKLVCLHHTNQLCSKCPPSEYTLRYRYNVQDLPPLLDNLRERSESFEDWIKRANQVFDTTRTKMSLKKLRALLSEAEEKSFPEVGEVGKLNSLVSEAGVCVRVAQQLLKTWNRDLNKTQSLGTISDLRLEEILGFQKQIQELPCIIDHSDQVFDYVARIKVFVEEADEALKQDPPCYDVIKNLLTDSQEFEIDLPQIPKLRRALKQGKWLEEVKCYLGFTIQADGSGKIHLKDDEKIQPITITKLRELIEASSDVLCCRQVELTTRELQRFLSLAETWEDQCRAVLMGKCKISLNEARKMVNTTRDLPVELPHMNKLVDAVLKSQRWEEKAKSMMEQKFYPYQHELQDLSNEAKKIVLSLDYVRTFEHRLMQANNWLETTVKTFAKKNSDLELLQILTPRDESDLKNRYVKVKRKRSSSSPDELALAEKSARLDTDMGSRDLSTIVDSYCEAEKREMEAMRKLREANDARFKKLDASFTDQEVTNYDRPTCICRKPSDGFMIQCELCHEWYHQVCISFNKLLSGRNRPMSDQQMTEIKYLCPLCQRSRRPKLDEVLHLLLELQSIPVRIREGEALQLLADRAVKWQQKAREVLNSSECKTVLDSVRASNSLKDQSTGVKNDDVTTPDVTAETDCSLDRAERDSVDDAIDAVVKHGGNLMEATCATDVTSSHKHEIEAAEAMTLLAAGCLNSSSSPIETDRPSSPDLECHEKIDSTPTKSDDVSVDKPFSVSEETKLKLDELMFEGEFIEIGLSETQLIWKILGFVYGKKKKNVSADHSNMKDEKKVPSSCDLSNGFRDKGAGHVDKKKTPETKRKRRSRGLQNKIDSSTERIKTEKKRRKREEKQALIVRAKAATNGSGAVDDDENAICSAKLANGSSACQQPVGDKVDWVQCDGVCQEWFHCLCVQICPLEAAAVSIYRCQSCSAIKHG